MRILAVNVRSGGIKARVASLLERAIAHNPDVIALSEYRDTPTGERIRTSLQSAGYPFSAYTAEHRGNGVLVVARRPFTPIFNPAGLPEVSYPNAMIECIFDDLHVIGVYLPGQDRKRPHLEFLIHMAQVMNERGVRTLCIGDFNSGRNDLDIEANRGGTRHADEFSTADLYTLLERQWTEAWLHLHPQTQEFSWYPRMGEPQRKNGWRLDKAFVSRSLLAHVTDARYDHSFRLDALTDHSALIVDID